MERRKTIENRNSGQNWAENSGLDTVAYISTFTDQQLTQYEEKQYTGMQSVYT